MGESMRGWTSVWVRGAAITALAVLGTDTVSAQGRLSGVADVSAAQTQIGDVDQSTLRQMYSARYERSLTSILEAQASLYFTRFDVDGAEALGSFEEELQPGARLTWTPRGIRFVGSGRRRIATSPISTGDLVTDDLLLDLETQPSQWPTLRFAYRYRDIEDTQEQAVQDVRDRSALASANWLKGASNFYYQIEYRETTNQVSDRTTEDLSQAFRYGARYGLGDDFRLDSQYQYRRRDQSSQALTGDVLLDPIDVDRGLYARDPAPEFGALAEARGLLDGNTELPTDPAIDIGAGEVDQNLGLDFGFTRPVSGVDIYTDRLSGTGVVWEIYASPDNLEWERTGQVPLPGIAPSSYNVGLQRFELRFATLETRYLKVVSRGGNTVTPVLVTELEALEALDELTEIERDDSSHRADLNLTYRTSEVWQVSLLASANLEPARGSLDSRRDLSYGLRAYWEPLPTLRHNLQWQQFRRDFDGPGADQREDRADYSLRYVPLNTVQADLGLSAQATDLAGLRSEERYSAATGISLEPWEALRNTIHMTVSRADRPQEGTRIENWRLQTRTSSELTRWSQLGVEGVYQETTVEPQDRLLVRRSVGIDYTVRPFPAALIRGSANWVDDQRFRRRYDALVSWNLARRFNLVAQMSVQEGGLETVTKQFSLNYAVSSRSRLYLQYSEVDREGDSQDLESFRQGFRQSF